MHRKQFCTSYSPVGRMCRTGAKRKKLRGKETSHRRAGTAHDIVGVRLLT